MKEYIVAVMNLFEESSGQDDEDDDEDQAEEDQDDKESATPVNFKDLVDQMEENRRKEENKIKG